MKLIQLIDKTSSKTVDTNGYINLCLSGYSLLVLMQSVYYLRASVFNEIVTDDDQIHMSI